MRAGTSHLFWIGVTCFVVGIIVLIGYALLRIERTTEKVVYTDSGDAAPTLLTTMTELSKKPDITRLAGYNDGRINILLLGIAGTEKQGAHLTDTIIIASIDTTQKKVALLSLPRDLLVPTADGTFKINTLYDIGRTRDRHTSLTKKAITHITGLPIHYDLVMDFAGFERVVDALGGINVTVPREIYDERYPGPGYSYETFHITEGFHTLDGATALKYARTRYADPESDFGRAKRQQVILSAIRNKALSREMLKAQTITELLATLEAHVRTSITPTDIRALIELLGDVDTQNITNVVIDAWKPESLLVSIQERYGRTLISGLAPRTGNWTEVRRAAHEIFARDARERRQHEIREEAPSLLIYTPPTITPRITERVSRLLTSAGFEQVTFATQADDVQMTQKTSIYDHSDGRHPFSLDELIGRLAAERSQRAPDQGADATMQSPTFTITLGTTLISNLSYEEISRDALAEIPHNKPLPLTH